MRLGVDLPSTVGDTATLRAYDPAALPRRLALRSLIAGVYLVLAAGTTGVGPVQAVLAALAIATALATSDGRRQLADATLPFLLFAAIYLGLGHWALAVAARGVHVFLPYWLDKRIFGLGPPAARLSCNEFFATHHWPAVDFIAGIAYLGYFYAVVLFSVYLALVDRSPEGRSRLRRLGWTFLAVNLAGLATYVASPVAPPWYVAAHGFGPVDPAAPASPAALVRWDQLTGTSYFAGMYAQASDVFGAFPSLHCAYPILLALFAWEMRRWRLAAALGLYQLAMCFSAVYLQHHYVTDVIGGSLYATAGYLAGRQLWSWLRRADPRKLVVAGW